MCACGGTGGIQTEHTWGITFHPCPDTNCEFDREKRKREYEEWKQRVIDKLGNIFEEAKHE